MSERNDTYVWEDLNAATFEKGAAAAFKNMTAKLRDYAIAGTLHLDHLASLRSSAGGSDTLDRTAFQLSRSRGLPEAEVRAKLERLLRKHEEEWKAFMNSLAKESFLNEWAVGTR